MFSTDFSLAERRRLQIITAVLMLVLVLPYLWAWLTSPGDGTYSGFLYNLDDQNVHLSWMRQAHDGAFFLRDLFTTEALSSGERPLFTNLLCWIMGVFARITHLPLVVVYHAFRIVFAALALRWFAALVSHLTNDTRVRFLSICLAAFGGGAGFLAPLFPTRTFIDRADAAGGFPMMPEAFTFASAFVFPLFIVSIALLPLIYLLAIRAMQTGKIGFAFGAAFAAFLLTNIHTYDALPLNVVMLIWIVSAAISSTRNPVAKGEKASRMPILAPLFVILGTAPMLVYQRFVVSNSEEFRVKALSPKPPPPLLDLCLSYGPLLILALVGIYFVVRAHQIRVRENDTSHKMDASRGLIMALWAIVTLAMVYAPQSLIPFARKMIEGVHLPLCFLAALGFVTLLDKLRISHAINRGLAVAFVALMSVSSLTFVNWCLENARDNNASRLAVLMPPLYLPHEATDALQFLDKLDEPRNRAVLCSPLWGNYVPAATGFPVYAGHFDETLHFPTKLGEMARFFSGRLSADESLRWLRKNRIAYVLIGPNERAFGARDLAFEKVWQGGNSTIYRVP